MPLVDHGLEPVVLEKQQRVWWHDGTRWMVGRVDSMDQEGEEAYYVDFPNGRTALVPGAELHVRWSRPLADPVKLLQSGAVETRYFHSRRTSFLHNVAAQRVASEGFGGVLSAAVDLYAHQVGAARRVLMDPVRRYLLADEVGLGKTIEAGMVLRQLLLDSEGDALVLVPDSLVGQWEDELESKFRTAQFGDRVRVLPHREISQISGESRLLVIVDEAHSLTEHGNSSDVAARDVVYRHLCDITHSSSALLLLSATPVRSNEDGFLRLLHLLDPMTYPLEDLEAFRQRVAIRDDLAMSLSSLAEETPIAYLAEPSAELRRLLPQDPLLVELLNELDAALADEVVGDARATCRRIRTHLSDTYRIHRRLIRTRRTPSLSRAFPVRGRSRNEDWLLRDPDRRRKEVLVLVDNLRTSLAGRDDLDGPLILRTVLGRALAPVTALSELAVALRGDPEHDLSLDEIATLAGLCASEEGVALADAIDAVVSEEVDDDRFSAMVAWAWPYIGRRRLAVACSFPKTASRAADRLEAEFRSHRVTRLLEETPEAQRSAEVKAFTNDPDRTIIVLDRVGEEGVNLQIVDEVLHLDLPTTSSRLEQRLGRFDRWTDRTSGAKGAVRSVAFAELDPQVDEHFGAWRRGLDEGLELFERSSATLQYVIPEVEKAFFEEALDRGLIEAGKSLAERRDQLQRQRRRIEGQDLLDAIDDRTDDDRYLQQLREIDDDKPIELAFRGYAADMLGFTATDTSKGTRYGVSSRRPPRLTESEVLALGAENFRLHYVSDRAKAKPGSGFLRWGEPLVSKFTDLAVEDDRGRAFTVEVQQLRRDPDAGPLFVYCFDILVQAGEDPIDDLEAVDESAGLAARARLLHFLAPKVERVWWLPGHGEAPESMAYALDAATRTGTNLGSRPDRFEELVRGRSWARHCEEAAESGLGVVAGRTNVRAHIAQARTAANLAREREEAIAAARARAGTDHPIDHRMFDAVAAAIENVQLIIDSCGAVIITSKEQAD